MRFSARSWAILSVLLFVAAFLLWKKGNQVEARRRLNEPVVAQTNEASKPGMARPPGAKLDPVFNSISAAHAGAQLATLSLEPLKAEAVQDGKADPETIKRRMPYRLQNTEKPLNQLVKDDGAVLLANALIDTRGELPEIPKHLKADADPGSYIVQWTGPADAEFRARLQEAGARIVSYVPNNAYYVQVDKAGADNLAATPGVRAVMPFEPYYKLDRALLPFAVEQRELPPEAMIRVTVLPGTDRGIAQEIRARGGQIIAEEESPFGPQYLIRPGANALVGLAQLNSVQGIERASARKPAADLSRVTLGIAVDGTNENYLGLTGEGSLVNVNDSGIQPTHPALQGVTIHLPGQPLASLMTTNNDPDGHGTFVASLIAGTGANSPTSIQTNTVPGSGTNTNTTEIVTILPGSFGNPSLRGMAPEADLLALPLDPTGPGYADVTRPLLDTWLIEAAAQTNYAVLRRTNAPISNNSWTYGIPDYDSSAARYDQAVRDALPASPNEQPLLFVFAAGNSGFGLDDGTGGSLDTVESPGTAKNVITVGALESLRLITNVSYSITNFLYFTNVDGTVITNEQVETIFPFAEMTDSASEVASFSSRGNVGVGIEGDFGRFKPDVVAPGTMLIAARSDGWNFDGIDTNDPTFGELLLNLHEGLEPYRYGNGSTFAAANVSGMLALMEEYYRAQAPGDARNKLSPALMKALLINGARSLGGNYDLAVESAGNFQGWGLPRLPDTLSSYTTNSHASVSPEQSRLRFVEQSASNAVVTGQSRTWNVTLSSNANFFPLRVTLVWTDPPGNPAVAVKLVNDLDLVVTNLETGTVFYGNRLVFGGDFSEPITPEEGMIEPVDSINNVENIMIRNPSDFGSEFSITVRGSRVNVNAVSDYLAANGTLSTRTNDVAQDFALVISSEMGADPELNDPTDPEGYFPSLDVFDKFERVTQPNTMPRRPLTVITNGLPLLEERVGANPSMIGTNGAVGQWNFYVFTNITVTNSLVTARAGSNVAFVTFNPPNLSRQRSVEADIDLYVSKDAGLTNLQTSVVANSFKSRERGGIETVVFTNAAIGDVYYVGVKSEDQQGAEYSFIGVSSDRPFEEDRNGQSILWGVPVEAAVLDGTARRPTAGMMLAIGLSQRRVANVVVTNMIFHENLPDLVGVFSHGQTRTILNNHTFGSEGPYGTNLFIYNDNPMVPIPGTQNSDGPGQLIDFVGQKVVGPWFLEMIDNSPSHTGRVQLLTVVIDPLRDPLLFGEQIHDTINPGQVAYYPIDLPPNVTNLTFRFENMSGGRLEFFIRRDALPTTNLFAFRTNIVAPGAVFSLPVIGGGTYFIALRNPTAAPVTFDLTVDALFANDDSIYFDREGEIPVVQDVAATNEVIDFNLDKIVADVQVGVRMKHPRTADIELALLSPQGTRVLLAENRGQKNDAGFGSFTIKTNGMTTNGSPIIVTQATYVVFTERTNLSTNFPVKFANPGTTINLGALGTAFENGFEESVLAGNYDAGTALAGGWTVIDSPDDTNTPVQVSVINGLGLADTGDTFISLGTAGLRRSFPITPGRPYTLRFAARAARVLDLYSTGVTDGGTRLPAGAQDPHYMLLRGNQTEFLGPRAYVFGNSEPAIQSGLWMSNSALSQWIAPYPTTTSTNGTGTYVFRTYVNIYEEDPRAAIIPTFRWSADDVGNFVRLNGVVLRYPAGSPTNFSVLRQLGGLKAGLNVVDFFVTDTNGVEGLRVEATGSRPIKHPEPLMNARIGGITQQFQVTPNWDYYEVTFTPTNSTATLDLLTERGEVWVDSVSVETSGDIFVQPEESFEILDGERAMGEWRIEVRDTRTGAVLPTDEVLEWNIELALVDPVNRAFMAENGFDEEFTLRTNQVQWLVLDACRSATFARLKLTGLGNFDQVEMRADWSGFPSGFSELEDFIPMRNNQNPGEANGELVFEVNRSLPAPARFTGKPLYVAIYNRFQAATNSYRLEFVSDGDCTPLTPPPIIPPGGSGSGSLPPNTGGGSTNINDGLFQFNVGPNVGSVTVTVVSDQDVSVFGNKDEPPTTSLFSNFEDANNGSGTETMVITPSLGQTVDLGTWFVRIVNDTSVQANFTVTVTFQFVTPPGQIQMSVFPLTGGGVQLQWFTTEPGVTYEVLGSNTLAVPPTAWTVITQVTANGPTTFYNIPDTSTPQYRFYTIRQVP